MSTSQADPCPGGRERSRFPGGGGSTRDARLHRATLEATRELLEEVGYVRLTVEGIAQRAGVGKPTIYRWWRNKAAIVHEAVWLPGEDARGTDTGELAPDMRAVVGRMVAYFRRPAVLAAFAGLVGEMVASSQSSPGGPELDDASERPGGGAARALGPAGLEHLRSILGAARDRGDLRADADIGTAVNMVIGTVLSTALAGSTRPPDALADSIVDQVLHGLLPPGRPAGS